METIELNLVIGGTVYKERQEADSLFIIVRGQVVLMKNSKKISYIGTKQIFGHSKIQLSMVKVLKKRQLQVKQYAEHLDSEKANSFSQNIQTFCHKNLKPQQYQEKEVEIQLYQQSAKVISDRAIIYKINKSMLQSLNNMFSHVSLSSAYTKPKQKGTQTNLVKNTANIKKMKWRQQRLTNELNFQKQSIQLRNRKQKMSFFQKHTILKSFYNSESSLTPRKIQFHKINSKDKTYNSQQQYYDIALNTLKRLRKQKYGEDFQDGKVTVLFPLKLEQKFNKRFRTQTIISNRCKTLSTNSKSKSKQKENQMSRTLNLVKMWRNNFKASKSP